ncbi:hypothetical protein K402DRAFT_459347 [Aulographum hederae CBS 113979]|uniref:Zn(2)-C6 fungal-type domain-containing protein n=1 Tax=Aulographum hederae CBS 113979 TaxID=1176131 RepID=A0A6G1HE43_9PEZI|nr:hypothetical protein K402DRAFT_459347 [Aulographum hederae CBS 113979]
MASSHARSVKACTACRQVKLKCDAREKFPDQCSRCKARGLACTIDATFKRTPARRRLEEVTKQLQDIKQALGISPHSNGIPSAEGIRERADSLDHIPDHSGATDTSRRSYDGRPSKPDIPVQPLFGLDRPDGIPSKLMTMTLGTVEVDPHLTLQLFQYYADNLHQYSPIISNTVTIDKLQRSEPLLFWTIIIIACRNDPACPVIFPGLINPYRELLGSCMVRSPYSLRSIQAILLISLWPFPIRTQPEDPGWIYVGAAMNAAQHLGIHRPAVSRGRSDPEFTASECTLTWAACFWVSTQISSHLGICPPLHNAIDMDAIVDASRENALSRELAPGTHIQYCLAKLSEIMTNPMAAALQDPLLRAFEDELNSLKTKYDDMWSNRLEVQLLVAKLMLFAMAMSQIERREDERADILSSDSSNEPKKVVLYSALATAVQVINLVHRMFSDIIAKYPSGHHDFVFPLPKVYFRGITFSAVFLLRYFILDPSPFPSDMELARNNVTMVHDLFARFSNHPFDEAARVVKFLEALGRQNLPRATLRKINIRDRLGAGLVMAGIKTAWEMQKEMAQAEKDVSEDDPSPIRESEGVTPVTGHSAGTDQVLPETQIHLPMPMVTDGPDAWLSGLDLPGGMWDVFNDSFWGPNDLPLEGFPGFVQ